MRYLCLIYANEAAGPKEGSPEAEKMMGDYWAYTTMVKERGAYLSGEALHPIASATSVKVRNGDRIVTDGPFAETKEQLGGFYLLECKDLDEAIELAAKIPSADHGTIEIRPIVEFG